MTEPATNTPSTIFFDSSLLEALRLRAAHTNRTISDIVNDAVREALGEDVLDLQAFDERAKEPTMSYQALLRNLRHKRKKEA